MFCPRCKNKMQEERRPFHKQRKWICPKCGKVRFQQAGKRKGERDVPKLGPADKY